MVEENEEEEEKLSPRHARLFRVKYQSEIDAKLPLLKLIYTDKTRFEPEKQDETLDLLNEAIEELGIEEPTEYHKRKPSYYFGQGYMGANDRVPPETKEAAEGAEE